MELVQQHKKSVHMIKLIIADADVPAPVSPWRWWFPPSQVSLWDEYEPAQAQCRRRRPGDVQTSDPYDQHTESTTTVKKNVENSQTLE